MIDYEIADQYLESEASRSVRDSVVLTPDLLEKVIEYIEEAEVVSDGEWGSNRNLKQLVEDGVMPDIYGRLLEIKSACEK